MARFILGQMVLHVLRDDPYMKAWYGRIKKRRGSKIARVAVMRRLACILWHMVKHKQPYVRGGPRRIKQMKEAFGAVAPSGLTSARARQKGAAPSTSAVASTP